jgi:hypothetical protein
VCAHRDQTNLRLITHTRYGPMLGCLACGTSWLVREAGGSRDRRESPSGRSRHAVPRASSYLTGISNQTWVLPS